MITCHYDHSQRVLGAIAHHVDAKRYLCFARPEYYQSLSEDSKRSLELQGGVFDQEAAHRFLARPGAAEAVRVREWDDKAKSPEEQTPPLSHFLLKAKQCMK